MESLQPTPLETASFEELFKELRKRCSDCLFVGSNIGEVGWRLRFGGDMFAVRGLLSFAKKNVDAELEATADDSMRIEIEPEDE